MDSTPGTQFGQVDLVYPERPAGSAKKSKRAAVVDSSSEDFSEEFPDEDFSEKFAGDDVPALGIQKSRKYGRGKSDASERGRAHHESCFAHHKCKRCSSDRTVRNSTQIDPNSETLPRDELVNQQNRSKKWLKQRGPSKKADLLNDGEAAPRGDGKTKSYTFGTLKFEFL